MTFFGYFILGFILGTIYTNKNIIWLGIKLGEAVGMSRGSFAVFKMTVQFSKWWKRVVKKFRS